MKEYRKTAAILAVMLAAFALLGITGAKAPVDEAGVMPENTAVPVAEGQSISEDAKVYQTMYFTRCSHSVSRRTNAAEQVQGAAFDDVRAYYDQWTILTLTEDKVEMERQIALFCPMHKVLSLSEAGQVVLSENRYGDGMALLKIYDAADMDERTREMLIAGLGFDSEEDAKRWLEENGLIQ